MTLLKDLEFYATRPLIDPILLTTVRVLTFQGNVPMTNASGFFFQRDDRLFLVTSLHVLINEQSEHFPNRVEIELHTDAQNFTRSSNYSIPLYQNGRSIWIQAEDSAGDVDVAAIEIDRALLPGNAIYNAFTPEHLQEALEYIGVGTLLSVVGFPLGFHDSLHHMPVARHAVVASSFGMRFQGQGYFLTDARTHRGTSGAPVVMRTTNEHDSLGNLQWILIGVHSSRMDVGTRDVDIDEALGLNCAWYADILLAITRSA